ncbi:polysaccharide deacetylase family protein [uncultured Chloroflexus sp.]|uniref:polysaccharide deacetylase family protein n=1 Tax=uncultured Chloroflexus sp. TaxID=214040 RepID=UPI00260C3315|nr:polysaccharide deacetylase family protein [uncultured Chloroflexus sp.]
MGRTCFTAAHPRSARCASGARHFFLVGQHAVERRDLVARIAAGGYAIGNYTFHRVRMTKISYAQRWRELRLTQQAVAPYGASLFRPPDGSHWYSSWLGTRLVGCDIGGWTAHIED